MSSTANMAPAGSVLCALLLSLTLPGLHSSSSTPGNAPTMTNRPGGTVTATDVPVTVSEAKATDAGTTAQPTTTTVPMRTTEAAAMVAPTSGVMITVPFASPSTVDSSSESTLGLETTTFLLAISDTAATSAATEATTSEETTEGPTLATSEGPSFLATTIHGQDPKAAASTTSMLATTTEPPTSYNPAGLGHSTGADSVDSPTPGASSAASEPDTQHTTEPATTALTNSPTSPLVNLLPRKLTVDPAFTITAYTSGSALAPVVVGIGDPQKPSSEWVIIVAVLAGLICVGGVICLFLLVKRRRRSQVKHFGSSVRSSQRSRKKRGAQDDTWAGPVTLDGVKEREDCEGGEEGEKAEEGERETDAVLSTFIADETEVEREGPDGGVGEVGSQEARKWEEEAPLLYIDEDAEEGTPTPANKSNFEGEKGGEGGSEREMEGNGLYMTGEMNGGAAYCLTTAV